MPPLPTTELPLIGRVEELHALTARALDAGSPSTTLVGGDAGVGKTRLLTELAQRADASGTRVLLGHCLDLGDSSAPYLPVSEMLARLAQDDHALAQQLVADRPLLSAVLPEYYRREVRADLPADRGSFFDAVHMLFEYLAQQSPLLVMIEDAHWADRSTRELLTFLFTRGFTGPVSLVVSFRSDDLHRRHPLRSKLAEWTRLQGTTRLMLDPLSDDQMRDLLHQLQPEQTADDTTQIVARAGGNPFFAEELLAASELGHRGLPDELADLLLVRIDALDDDTQAVVRAASVAGRVVDHELLGSVVDLPDRTLDRALRSIVDSHVFEVTSAGHYAFRHALLAEAVYDDLLPGERVQLHWKFADALRDRKGATAAAALARHARGANNHALALEASVRAGDEAMASAGPADAARHYEDALAMVSENTDLELNETRTSLVLKTIRALSAAGDPHRAADLASAEIPGAQDDPLVHGELVAALADAQLLAELPLTSAAELSDAIDALDDGPPSETLARMFAVHARMMVRIDDFDRAILSANRAAHLSREVDLPLVATDAMTTLARLDDFVGEPESAIKRLESVIRRAEKAGHTSAQLRAMHQLGQVHAGMDRFRTAAEIDYAAAELAHANGLFSDPFAIDVRVFGGLYAHMVGEWEKADEMLTTRGEQVPPLMGSALETVRMVQDAARGEVSVREVLPRLRPLWDRDMFVCIHASAVAVDLHGAEGDLRAMLRVHDEVIETFARVWCMDAFDARIRLSAIAIGHIATAVINGSAKPRDYTDRIAALAAAVEDVVAKRRNEDALGGESRAWVNRARAEVGRFEWGGRGEPSPQLLADWVCVVESFDTMELSYEAARSRVRRAELLAAAGERELAREVLASVHEIGSRLGAKQLIRQSRGPRASSDPKGLTPREVEVLGLVSRGRTNGEIAKELVISVKTASVHVSNILAKLGAATRTEAAAIAARENLLDQ